MSNQTKSVFLYAKPTNVKKEYLLSTQTEYTRLINHFIDVLIGDQTYYLDLLNNNKQSPIIRGLEKRERVHHQLGSAYGQNAIDHAVKEVHNHFTRIKNKLYGVCLNQKPELLCYMQSIALLNACLLDEDEFDTIDSLNAYEQSKRNPSKTTLLFYQKLDKELNCFTQNEREKNREEIRVMFYEKLDYWKTPIVKCVPLQLDSRVCSLENAEHIQVDYVLYVKMLNAKDRIAIPLKTSANSLRRLHQYKSCSPTITFKNNLIKVAIPFEKKVKESKIKNVLGIDVGITDLFYSSQNKSYGSFTGMVAFYENVLEPKLKRRSSLRNKMRSYQKELKKTTCSIRKTVLRTKIFNIANMLDGKKKVDKCRRQYSHVVDVKVNEAVRGIFADIKNQNVLVSMEALDITEFDRGKQANKRDSSWIRGKLTQKLQALLSWHGIPFVEVDPAYTSKACQKCHNIDNDNRKFKSFDCTVCRHTSDADYNASINIANRAFDKEIHAIVEKYRHSTDKRHQAIKTLYKKRHEEWLKTHTVAV